MFSGTITSQAVINGASTGGQKNVEGDQIIALSIPLVIGTDFNIPMVFAAAKLKALVIVSDQDATLEWNSGSSPAGTTLNLKANAPFIWDSDNPMTNPCPTNVTGIYLTNAVAIDAFQFTALIDN